MFCPFCGIRLRQITRFCFSCGRSLEILNDVEETEGPSAQGTLKQPENATQKEQPCPSCKQFREHGSSKSKKRQSSNCGPKGEYKQAKKYVRINVGLMVPHGTDLKPLRGKTVPLFTNPEVAAPDLLKQAVQKLKTFNKDIDDGPFILLYPDCSEVVHVPGSEWPFELAEHKKEMGKAYCRINFFICLETHYRGVNDTSDSNSEVVITSRSNAELNQADTVVFELQNQSTPKNKPKDERDALGHSSSVQPGQTVIPDTDDLDPLEKKGKTSFYGLVKKKKNKATHFILIYWL